MQPDIIHYSSVLTIAAVGMPDFFSGFPDENTGTVLWLFAEYSILSNYMSCLVSVEISATMELWFSIRVSSIFSFTLAEM